MKGILPTFANLEEVKRSHPEARQVRPKKDATFLCEGNPMLRHLNCMPVKVVGVKQNGNPRSHIAFVVFDSRVSTPGIFETNFAHLLEGGILVTELGLPA